MRFRWEEGGGGGTWARDADAMGTGSKSANSTEGGAPRSSSIVRAVCSRVETGHLSSRLSRSVTTYCSGSRWSFTHHKFNQVEIDGGAGKGTRVANVIFTSIIRQYVVLHMVQEGNADAVVVGGGGGY